MSSSSIFAKGDFSKVHENDEISTVSPQSPAGMSSQSHTCLNQWSYLSCGNYNQLSWSQKHNLPRDKHTTRELRSIMIQQMLNRNLPNSDLRLAYMNHSLFFSAILNLILCVIVPFSFLSFFHHVSLSAWHVLIGILLIVGYAWNIAQVANQSDITFLLNIFYRFALKVWNDCIVAFHARLTSNLLRRKKSVSTLKVWGEKVPSLYTS